MSDREQKQVRTLFGQLVKAPLHLFPKAGERLSAPNERGIYIIYSPRGKIIHVGRTPSGRNGLRQRLSNHLYGASSFTIHYLGGQGSKLRAGYKFQYLSVADDRRRALLEAYAIGSLCPSHLGLGQITAS